MMTCFQVVCRMPYAVAESEASSIDIPPLLRTQGNYADSFFFVFLVGCLCPRPLLLMSEPFLGLVRHCTHPVSPQSCRQTQIRMTRRIAESEPDRTSWFRAKSCF